MAIDKFENQNFFLSNFYNSPLWYDGELWPTVEHAFQAAKVDTETAKQILVAKTPGEAKRLGRRGTMRPDWDTTRIKVMRECLQRKFLCNDDLLKRLLATGDEELIEGTTWHDNFWGNCTCPKCANITGQNMLGKLLMEIRDKARRGMYVWGVWTTTDEYSGKIHYLFKERKDAEKWLSENYDWYCSEHCIPDDKHLRIIELE